MDLAFEIEALEDGQRVFIELDRRLGLGDEAIDEALDVLVERLVINDDLLRVVASEVANDAKRQVVLGVEHGRRAGFGMAVLDRCPDRCEVTDVCLEVGLAHPVSRRPDDEAEVLGAQPLDDLAEPAAFLVGADAP